MRYGWHGGNWGWNKFCGGGKGHKRWDRGEDDHGHRGHKNTFKKKHDDDKHGCDDGDNGHHGHNHWGHGHDGHHGKHHWGHHGGHHRKKHWQRDDDDGCGRKKFDWKNWCEERKPVTCEPDNRAPEITSPEDDARIFVSNVANQVVLDVDAIDPDGDTIMFRLSGDDADKFRIDEETGEISINGVLPILSDTGVENFDVTVTAEDPEGLSDSIDIELNLILVA